MQRFQNTKYAYDINIAIWVHSIMTNKTSRDDFQFKIKYCIHSILAWSMIISIDLTGMDDN